jgi:hypothetical protein
MIRFPPLEIHKWPAINFSHYYTKMPEEFQKSKLIEVLPIKLEDLSKDFLLYDTCFLSEGDDGEGDVAYYPLPSKGNYMILLLLTEGGQLWTTIRSQWSKHGNKLEYYRGAIGEIFECKIL